MRRQTFAHNFLSQAFEVLTPTPALIKQATVIKKAL